MLREKCYNYDRNLKQYQSYDSGDTSREAISTTRGGRGGGGNSPQKTIRVYATLLWYGFQAGLSKMKYTLFVL